MAIPNWHKKNSPGAEDRERYPKQVQIAAERGKGLVRQILTFHRKAEQVRQSLHQRLSGNARAGGNSQHSADPDLPVTILTGDGSEGQRAEALEAGITEYLVKPLTPGDLIKALSPLFPTEE